MFWALARYKKRPPKRRSPGSIPVVLELMVGVVGFEPTTPYTYAGVIRYAAGCHRCVGECDVGDVGRYYAV